MLEGTLQRADARMRVTLRLVDVANGTQIWTGTFEEKDGEVFKREYAEAEAQCRRVLEMDPNFMVAHLYLYFIYLRQGKLGEARQAGQDVRRLTGGCVGERD